MKTVDFDLKLQPKLVTPPNYKFNGDENVLYDTEEVNEHVHTAVFFQRPVGQHQAVGNHVKTFSDSNVVMPSCLQNPVRFSLFDIYVSALDGGSLEKYGDAVVSFSHRSGQPVLHVPLSALKSEPTPKRIPDDTYKFSGYPEKHFGQTLKVLGGLPPWFVDRARFLLETDLYDELPQFAPETFKTGAECRHMQPSDYFQLSIRFDAIVKPPMRIRALLHGIMWTPK